MCSLISPVARYLMDSDNQQLPAVSGWRWLLRIVVLLLQVAPILRYVDSIRWGGDVNNIYYCEAQARVRQGSAI